MTLYYLRRYAKNVKRYEYLCRSPSGLVEYPGRLSMFTAAETKRIDPEGKYERLEVK